MDLHNRVALVTGGSRGIGRSIALVLADAGAAVAVNYRERAQEAAEVVEVIHATGRLTTAIGADVSMRQSVVDMIAQIESELGPIDVLVNNAGVVGSRRAMTPATIVCGARTKRHGCLAWSTHERSR
jgi:3-oxoacyl-[acyl-carrier protein] reductase